jgi:hypothetical protein
MNFMHTDDHHAKLPKILPLQKHKTMIGVIPKPLPSSMEKSFPPQSTLRPQFQYPI